METNGSGDSGFTVSAREMYFRSKQSSSDSTLQKARIQDRLFLICILISGLLIISISPLFVSAKYYTDSSTIISYFSFITSGLHMNPSDGFANATRFYMLLGFGPSSSQSLVGVVNYLFYFGCLLSLYVRAKSYMSAKQFLIFLIWNIPVGIYFGQYSKESIALVVLTLLLHCMSSKRIAIKLLGLSIVCSYAQFFRSYWYLVVYLMLVYMFSRRLRRPRNRFWFFILCIGCLFLVAGLTGHYLTDSRYSVNQLRDVSINSTTMVRNLMFNSSPITDIVNWIVAWICFIIPIPLVIKPGIQHLVFAIFDLFMVIWFIKIKRLGDSVLIGDAGIKNAMAIILAYSVVQGMFEPDYGSYVKHGTVLLPVFYFLVLRVNACLKLYKDDRDKRKELIGSSVKGESIRCEYYMWPNMQRVD